MKAFDPNYKLLDEMYQDDYYDAKGEVCAVYVRFIDIEASYKEQA